MKSNGYKHGLCYTRIYSIYRGVKSRCYNKNEKAYKNYGGRGITMCDEWLNDVTKFYEWAMSNGYSDELTLDKDYLCNKLNIYPKIYSPETCMWADASHQNKHREFYERTSTKNKNSYLYRNTEYVKEKITRVVKMDIDMNVIKEYNSLQDASRDTEVNSGGISKCCNGKRKRAGGFKWAFV
jgi:hypothetical protein